MRSVFGFDKFDYVANISRRTGFEQMQRTDASWSSAHFFVGRIKRKASFPFSSSDTFMSDRETGLEANDGAVFQYRLCLWRMMPSGQSLRRPALRSGLNRTEPEEACPFLLGANALRSRRKFWPLSTEPNEGPGEILRDKVPFSFGVRENVRDLAGFPSKHIKQTVE
jgi:hypothetical protein